MAIWKRQMSATQSVEVYHFNVGQGDSCLIVVRNSTPNVVVSAVLVDGGIRGSWQLIKRYIGQIQKIVGTFTLTAIVISHYDEDHVGGIVAMLTELKEGEPITIGLFRTGPVKTMLYDPGPIKLNLEKESDFGAETLYGKYLELVATPGISGYVSRAMTAPQLDQLQNSPDPSTYGPLIGREIFWNESPADFKSLDAIQATGFANLVTQNQLTSTARPNLFIVAMNGLYLGYNLTQAYKTSEDSGGTRKNVKSLVCVLTSSQNTPLHYFGGDTTKSIEEGLSIWKFNSPNNVDDIPFMKISHHGALTSTPLILLNVWRPTYVVISAGQNKGHYHPSWQRLLTLLGLGIKILPTSYPFYLNLAAGNIKTEKFDMSLFVKETDGGGELMADLETYRSYYLPRSAEIIANLITQLKDLQTQLIKAAAFSFTTTVPSPAPNIVSLIQAVWPIRAEPSGINYVDRFRPVDTSSATVREQSLKWQCIQIGPGVTDGNALIFNNVVNQDIYDRPVSTAAKRKVPPNAPSSTTQPTSLAIITTLKLRRQPSIYGGSSSVTLYNNSLQGLGYSPFLTTGAFNDFVSLLPGGVLVLVGPSTINSDGSCTGIVGADWGEWLTEFNLTNLSFTLQGSVSGNSYNVTSFNPTTATLTINGQALTLTGTIANNIVFLTLTNTPYTVKLMATLLAIMSWNSNDSLLGYTSTADVNVQIDSSNFQLILDPYSDYTVSLQLPLLLSTTNVQLIPGIYLTNPSLILNQTRRLVTSNVAEVLWSIQIQSGIQITNIPGSSLTVGLSIDNRLIATLDLSLTLSFASLSSNLQTFTTVTPSQTDIQNFIGLLPAAPTLNGDCTIRANLRTATVFSFEASVSFTITISNNIQLSVTGWFFLPSFEVQGFVQVSSLSTCTLGQLLPSSIPAPAGLGSAPLLSMSFYVNKTGYYELSAVINTTLSLGINNLIIEEISFDLTGTGKSLNLIKLSISILICDATDADDEGTDLTLSGSYQNGIGWELNCLIDHLSPRSLIALLPTDLQDKIVSIMPSIQLSDTLFSYNLTSGVLVIQSSIQVGQALFSFSYINDPTQPSNNQLSLELRSLIGDINIGDLLQALGISGIPSIIANLNLPFAAMGVNYDFSQNVLTLSTTNEAHSFQIILSRYLNTSGQAQYFLRLIITGISGFPLVGDMTLPLERFFLIYATDPGGINTSTFTSTLALQQEPDPTSYNAVAQMYLTNSSFMITKNLQAFIVGNEQIGVIGPLGGTLPSSTYTGQNTQSSPPAGTPPSVGQPGDGGTPGGPQSSNTPATWIKIQKSFGPIYINRIGFSVGSTVWILLDARLTFGPLMINLQGLSLGLQISPLQFEPQFTLSGLGIDYSSGNLSINGTLVRLTPPPSGYVDLFQGGVTISYKPYTITAIGSYGRALNPNGDGDIVTFFVFGRVKAPFGGPPEAYVTGLAAGFGYNQTLNLPTIDNVNEFPLVQGSIDLSVLSDDPFTTLQALFNTGPSPDLPWIVPNFNDGKWLAVGVDFNTYGLIDTRALLTVGFGDLLEIAILGRSTFSLPKYPASVPQGPKYVYLEIGLRVLIQPDLGFWGVSAVLSPNSYVMGPFCKVQGGFAWFNWFGKSPHAGDFVFTVGGYHPRFTPPSHYPVVDRIGYGWQYSDNISIGGDAYFALTPNCVMAGGSYNLNFHAGDLRAWFNAKANAIVYWNPFWFDVDVGIRIGASYRVNCLFFSFSIKVEIGADLEIWGPPLGGRIDVDLGPFGFTIEFGQGKSLANTYLTWPQFLATLPQSPPVPPSTLTTPTYLNILPSQGVVPVNTPGQVNNNANPWTVRGNEFEFRVEFTFPATYVVWNGLGENVAGTTNCFAYGTQSTFALRQMNIPSSISPGYQALYQINVTQGSTIINGWQMRGETSTTVPGWAGSDNNDVLDSSGIDLTYIVQNSYGGLETTNLPAAIWGPPVSGNAIFSSSSAVTVNHASAINLIAPPATTISSITTSILLDNLLTSSIPMALLALQTQSSNDPYWPTYASITPSLSNPGVIGLIKSALNSSSVTGARTSLVATLNAGLTANGAQAVYQVGTMDVLANYVEVTYPDPPLSFVGSSAAGSANLTITALNVDYSTTTLGNTHVEFTVGGNSITQGLGWIYTIYINDIVIVGPVTINNTTKIPTQIVVDQNVGFVYNPWTTYTVLIQDTNGNYIQSDWPLDQ